LKLVYLNPRELELDNANVRRERPPEGEEDLEASIASLGIIQPVMAREKDGKLLVFLGSRRLDKAKNLVFKGRLEKIPVIINNVDDKTAKILSLIENTHRAPITPVSSRTLRRWLSFGAVEDVWSGTKKSFKPVLHPELRGEEREKVKKTLYEMPPVVVESLKGLATRVDKRTYVQTVEEIRGKTKREALDVIKGKVKPPANQELTCRVYIPCSLLEELKGRVQLENATIDDLVTSIIREWLENQ